MTTPSAPAQLQFLTDLQKLLAEGNFVATYKYALLMALADLSVELGDDSGESLPIPLADIAEKFIQYYWRQSAPYPGAKHQVLLQNKGRQASVVNAVAVLSSGYRHSIARARRDAKTWNGLVKRVERTVEQMPLWRLQVIGTRTYNFLYPHRLRDGCIILEPGVTYCLRRFHPMIVHMLQGAWVAEVRRIKGNQPVLGQRKDLLEFMFGSQREPLTAYQPILMDVQHGECLYCGKRIKTSAAVDHFIPWARYPVDLGHNFVLAHAQCNSQKSDHLAALPHLERWLQRNTDSGCGLASRFDEKGLLHDLEASIQIARWAYAQAAGAGGLLWLEKELFYPVPRGWEVHFDH